MGLDQWIFRKEDDDVDMEGNIIEVHDIEMLYWRKANQIHGWFERLFGVENCEEYPVTIEQIKELRDTCQKVLDNHSLAEELLPVTYGCFFGSYEYDNWYFNQLEKTVKDIDKFLELDHDESDEFYYYAWW